MNAGLLDALRHNAWANRELLACCSQLTDEQRQASAVGTFGSVEATLWHVIAAEAAFLFRLTDSTVDWDFRASESPDMATLATRAEDVAARWEALLRTPFDAERIAFQWNVNDAVYDVPAGVLLAQAIQHGSEHRGQVCTVLTSIGVVPPVLDVWQFALATVRVTRRS